MMAAAFCHHPPHSRPVVLLVVILVSVIRDVDGVSIAGGIIASSLLSLEAL
jgi:hypothetical protein